MPKTLNERLREKGWSEEEISKTAAIMRTPASQDRHATIQRRMSLSFYWMMLILLTVANFFVSVSLIPFLLVLKVGQLAVIVGAVGFAFGLLFNLLIWDIEYIDVKHHLGSTLFLPALAIVSISLIVTASNKLAEHIVGGVHQSAVAIAGVYVFSFLAPYLFSVVRKNFWKV